jgi:tartrate-resistant acid phosphatase type 5
LTRFAVFLAFFGVAACHKPAPSGGGKEANENAASAERAVENGSVRFAVIGDFGADTPDEAAVAALVKSWNPAFVMTTGDNNYPSGAEATIDTNIGKFYADFIGHYAGSFGKGSAVNRFWPSPGNHDWVTPDLGPYRQYFTLPGNERYYDVDLGLVHLYALDSDRHEPDGTAAESTQAEWLKQRLSQSKSCFDIVYFHHPPYSNGPHGPSTYMRWPFRAWGAEAVLAGHDHIYERFEIDGIPYIVNGVGGAERYEFTEGNRGGASLFRYNSGVGAMLVTASATALRFEFITADGVRRDSSESPAHCKP